MFTGIVKGRGQVRRIEDKENFRSLELLLPEGSRSGVEVGASIAVDGVCLTVTGYTDTTATFDIIHETLQRTTLGELTVGAEVNIERAAREGVEIGGHPLSGHIDCVCQVSGVERSENNVTLTFTVPPPYIRYIFSKGYIGLNGTSLTVCNVDRAAGTFQVWLIPETLRITTFAEKAHGARINLEVERTTQVIVDTVRQFLTEQLSSVLAHPEQLLTQGTLLSLGNLPVKMLQGSASECTPVDPLHHETPLKKP